MDLRIRGKGGRIGDHLKDSNSFGSPEKSKETGKAYIPVSLLLH